MNAFLCPSIRPAVAQFPARSPFAAKGEDVVKPMPLRAVPPHRRRHTLTGAAAVCVLAALLTAPSPAVADGPSHPARSPAAPGAPADTAAVDDAGRTVVDVTDFGADPAGRADSAAAVGAAVAHAKTVEGPTTIRFPTGTYQLWPEKTPKRELYVSNTVGTDQTFKTKNIGILIEDMHDVVVDGGGSTIVNHGYQTVFAAIRSTDVRFTGFSQDWAAPKTVDITVSGTGVSDGRAYRIVDIPATYDYAVEGTSVRWYGERSPATGEPYWTGTNSFNYSQVHDPATKKTWRAANPVFEDVAGITDLGGDRLRIAYDHADPPADRGRVYQMRETTRDTPGALFWESERVTVDHLRLGYLHGFGLVGQFSEDITVDSVAFKADRRTGRVTSGFADHIQMSGVKGTVRVTDCVFDNPQDDPINVHGTYLQVTAAERNRLQLRYMHPETAGFPQFYPGDSLELVDKRTMLPVPGATATVVSVQGPTGEGVPAGADPDTYLRTMTVEVDRPLPAGVLAAPDGYVAENTAYTPKVEITGNTFRSVPTRGILVTTRRPVLIEDNRFDGMSMASIYISSDAHQWYESGPVRDVTIRRNIFDRPASPVVFLDPTNRDVVPGQPVHRGVLVEDNDFNLTGGTVVAGRSVGDLTFRRNRIQRYAHLRLSGPQEPLAVGGTAALTTDAPPDGHTEPLFTFDGADDVTVARNTYDAGFNMRLDTAAMDPAEVRVTGDDLALNTDNRTTDPVTVTYTSSDPAVAAVARDGTVAAVGAGQAVLTAHAVIGGEQVDSNPVTLTVTAPAPTPQEKG